MACSVRQMSEWGQGGEFMQTLLVVDEEARKQQVVTPHFFTQKE